MIDTIILAGGLGTRLSPKLRGLPKCAAKVGGKPFLYWILKNLELQGITDVTLALGYKSQYIINYINYVNNTDFSFDFRFIVEEELLGTGGAIRYNLKSLSTKQVLVLNGDSFTRFDLKKLLKIHESNKAVATIQLTELEDISEYGSVILDKDRVVEFAEKTGEKVPGLVNAGIYILNNPEILDYIPEGVVSLEKEVFPKLVAENKLYAITDKDDLYDIGTPERLKKADKFFKDFRRGKNDFSEHIKKLSTEITYKSYRRGLKPTIGRFNSILEEKKYACFNHGYYRYGR
jgi:D-glycero-alpha-D-manno-heptose 1-phosphate guanylyltransferase